jgi:hypothetical protein
MPSSQDAVNFRRRVGEISGFDQTKRLGRHGRNVQWQATRVFAVVKFVREHDNNRGDSTFITGGATVDSHALVDFVQFDSYAFNQGPLNVGPIQLPEMDPASVVQGTVLYGIAVYRPDYKKYTMRHCVDGRRLRHLCRSTSGSLQSIHADRRALAFVGSDGTRDESMFLAATLLHGDVSCAMQLVLSTPPPDVPKIPLDAVDFVQCLSLFCRRPNMFDQFAALIKMHEDDVRPDVVKLIRSPKAVTFTQEAINDFFHTRSMMFRACGQHIPRRTRRPRAPHGDETPSMPTKPCAAAEMDVGCVDDDDGDGDGDDSDWSC